MFAASKAFAIAQATLNLSSAISQVMNNPAEVSPAQKFASMAAVASAGGQLVSAISNATYGGGRQYGGPVDAAKMYRINETGAPEILNTASGKQYMLPNTRGQVVSNKDATGGETNGNTNGGTSNVITNVYVTEAGTRTETSGTAERQGRQLAKIVEAQVRSAIANERRQGGVLWNMQNGRV